MEAKRTVINRQLKFYEHTVRKEGLENLTYTRNNEEKTDRGNQRITLPYLILCKFGQNR